MGKTLDKQFGKFLRQQRGQATYAVFSRKIGVSASTLYRLENAEQSVTLGKLEDILKRLKRELPDMFRQQQCHRSDQNQPAGVDSKPASLR